jgi:MFS-type transporter involved in bile tolerance (Atg22 family)
MIEQLGGRKFIFAVLAAVLVFALVILKVVTPEDFLNLLKFLLATYTAGNVVSKFADKEV